MIALSVAKLKMFSPESEIFLWINPKKKNFFVESLDQFRRLEVREKARNVFLWWAYVCLTTRCYTTSHLHQVFFFSISLAFLAFFARISRLLDMRLAIANSALRASLAIYHLISNVRSWNNCYIVFVKSFAFVCQNKKKKFPLSCVLVAWVNFSCFAFSLE